MEKLGNLKELRINIYVKKQLEINSFEEIDSHSQIRFQELEIEFQNNLSFLPLEEFIPNETIITNKSKKWSNFTSTNKSRSLNVEGFWQLIIISFVLTILLLILLCIMLRFMKLFLNDFGDFIIFIWLTTSIFVYILTYPFLYYLKMFFGSILLFKCYHLRNRLSGKFLYWIFVDKTMIYMHKLEIILQNIKKNSNTNNMNLKIIISFF